MNKLLNGLSRLNWLTAAKASILGLLLALLSFRFEQLTCLSMLLGVVAAALADNPDFYRRRGYSLLMLCCSFSVASLSVTLLMPYPPLFLIGLMASSYIFMVLPRLGQNFASISLCSLIVAVYTMLGYDNYYENPWLQPALLAAGAACYALLSIAVDSFRPTQWLDKQLHHVFKQLSLYQLTKARLFDPNSDIQEVQLRLSQQRAAISEQLTSIRQGLYIHQHRRKNQINSPQMDRFFFAQQLHERMSSAHLDYQQIKDPKLNKEALSLTRTILVKIARTIPYPLADRQQRCQQIKQDIEQLHYCYEHSEKRLKTFNYIIQNLEKITEQLSEEVSFPEPEHQFSQLNTLRLAELLKQALHLNDPLNRHAVRMSLMLGCGYLLILLSGDPNGYWLLLSALLVIKPNYHDTKVRFAKRVFGTIVGVCIAGLAMWQLNLASLTLALPVLVLLFFLFFHQNYAISVMFITVYVAISLSLQGQMSEGVLATRLYATVAGSLLALAANRFLWPDWQRKQSRRLFGTAFGKIKTYLDAIFSQYSTGSANEHTDFRIARFRANQAEAELVRHWQRMLAEPQRQRRLSPHVYQLIAEMHLLLGHLSALSSHRSEQVPDSAHQALSTIGDLLGEELALLAEHIEHPSRIPASSSTLAPMITRLLLELLPKLYADQQLIAYQCQLLLADLERLHQLVVELAQPNIEK